MKLLNKAKKEVKKQAGRALDAAEAKAGGGDDHDDEELSRGEFDTKAAETIPGNVKMISGCKDEQTSADVHDCARFGLPNSPPGAGGACTNSLLKAVETSGDRSWIGILKSTRDILSRKGFTQIPQLSTSRALDMTTPFDFKPGHGRTRSLFIGINYVGQQGELGGCHNDCVHMMRYVQSIGYSADPDDVKILMDDGQHEQPKCSNIKSALRWLCEGAEAGDNLFMHYSGHGGSMKDDDGDEEDGMDETLVPVDYASKGQIRDDDLFDLLVNNVPAECNLTVVMDCCHSGSILDLPYTLKVDSGTMEAIESGKIPSTKPNPHFTGRLLKVGIALLRGQMPGASVSELRKFAMRNLKNK